MFSLFVLYGTTFPFSFGHARTPFHIMAQRISWHPLSSVPDMVQNILLFIPFGFLGYFSLIYKSSRLRKLAVVLLGAMLSAFVEFLQIYAPTRFPALADVLFNTIGTAVGLVSGILLKRSVLGFKSHPFARRFLDAPSAFPAMVFLIVVVAGCWVPFDFSLEVGSIWGHLKPLLHHPFRFTRPDDDMVACIQFLLASLFCCRVFKEVGWPKPALSGVMLLGLMGMVLEASQAIIVSRGPEVQDVIVAWIGAVGGGLAFLFPGFREKPWLWSIAGTLGVFLSALVRGLHPFVFHSGRTHFNWVLFLPQYENTTAAALGNFMISGMVFFPLGFLLGYFFPRSRLAPWLALFLSGAMALVVEIAQGWVAGRYSDITDVFGGMLGCLIGSLVLTRGWSAFTIYMRQDEDTQV